MQLNSLPKINKSPGKRLGRGLGSGRGKTAGRGTKGQKSRSGYNIPRRFEGGQTALIQRLPKKRGFRSLKEKPEILKISQIEKAFKAGELISPKTLAEKGLADRKKPVKILADKDLSINFKYRGVQLNQRLFKRIQAEVPSQTKVIAKSKIKKK